MSIENEDAFKTHLLTLPKRLSDRLKNGETSQELVDWALERIAAIKAETEADLAQYPHTSHRGIYGIGYKMLLATWSTFEAQAKLWKREQAGLSNSTVSSTQSSSISSTSKKSLSTRGDYAQGISKTPESPPRPVKLLKHGGYYISTTNTAVKPPQERKTHSSDRFPQTAEAVVPKEPSRPTSHAPRRPSRAPSFSSRPPEAQNYVAPRAPQSVNYAGPRPPQPSSRWEFPPNPLPKPPQPHNIPPLRTDWGARPPPGFDQRDPVYPPTGPGHPVIPPGHSAKYSTYWPSGGYPSR